MKRLTLPQRLKVCLQRSLQAGCGHVGYRLALVRFDGHTGLIQCPVKHGQTPYCPRCLERMTIRCAWCGQPIFVGDPVTLYTNIPEREMPDYAVPFSLEPRRYIGCLNWGCGNSHDHQGFWMPPGKVLSVRSPLEVANDRRGMAIPKGVKDLVDLNQ